MEFAGSFIDTNGFKRCISDTRIEYYLLKEINPNFVMVNITKIIH